MKDKIIKTIFRIIYIPFGLAILGTILGLIFALTGQAPLSNILFCVVGLIVLALICAGLKKLEEKLTGEE